MFYLVIIVYILCASMFTISKWALGYTEPIFFVAIRMILAGILLNSYCIAQKKEKLAKPLAFYFYRDWKLFAQIILFHIYLTYICDLCALKNISSVESAFLYNLSPFIAALFSYSAFHEKMTFKKWIGLLLGFFSLVPGFVQELLSGTFIHTVTPKLLTLTAVICSSYGWIVVRELVKERGYSSLFVNGIGMFFGGLLALCTSFSFEPWAPIPVYSWGHFIPSLLLIIILANILFYNLYGYLLKYYTATFLACAGFLCPLFAGFLGWLFLGELFPTHFIFSLLLVAVGLYLFYQEELRQGYIQR